MEIIKHYREHEALRRSFHALAEKTFGLNFEGWYQNGFWSDNYDPYSVVIDGKVVANVSVNRTDMEIDGQRRKLLQLGTVMTDEDFRNRGYIRKIMTQIETDHPDAEGIYLFANDSVVDLYPKFGFRREKEYQYTKTVSQDSACEMVKVPMKTPEDWALLEKAMEESAFRSGCDMVDNPGLIFFYVSQFMQDDVFYSKALDAWVIAEQENGELLIHNVFAKYPVSLADVIRAFGSKVAHVTLGFAPADTAGFEKTEYREADCTFFVKGEAFADFARKGLRIPTLSHA